MTAHCQFRFCRLSFIYRSFHIAILTIFFTTIGVTETVAGGRVALVIGNGDYQSSALKNPVNDARDISRALKQYGFQVATEINADQRAMEEAIDGFYRSLQRAEVGLFYYAGHGMQIDGHNYLIPVKSKITSASDVKYRSVDAGIVLGKMQDAGNRVNIVVLDACRDNPFRSFVRSSTQGLAPMSVPAGTILSYATAANSVAADGKGRNGLYTEHLLKNLKNPNLDVLSLFNRTALEVRRKTDEKQQPFIYFNGLEPIYLAGGNPDEVYSDAGRGYREEPKTGTIKVTSDPVGARVEIDGGFAGTTPLIIGNLAPGAVRVTVSRDGYVSSTREATIHAGRRAVVNFSLEQEQRAKTGWLTVNTTPAGAKVRILNIGPAYNPGMELAAGRYHLEVSAQGYETENRWVELAAGDDLQLSVILDEVEQRSRNFTDPVTGMEFVSLPGGCFQMGSPSSEKDRYSDEGPVHEVCVEPLAMGKYEVTVDQWRKFIRDSSYRTEAENDVQKAGCYNLVNNEWDYHDGYYWDNPGFPQSADQPVSCMSHNDVQEFLRWLNRKSKMDYRLPTEAEWEYAARAGTTTVRYWGDAADSRACGYGNVADEAHGWNYFPCDDGYKYSAPVGSFKANGFGLYDMLGNVWEWTADWYGGDYYGTSPRNNPEGPSSGSGRVFRGGGWCYGPSFVRSAYRSGYLPGRRSSVMGFRLVLPLQGRR